MPNFFFLFYNILQYFEELLDEKVRSVQKFLKLNMYNLKLLSKT